MQKKTIIVREWTLLDSHYSDKVDAYQLKITHCRDFNFYWEELGTILYKLP